MSLTEKVDIILVEPAGGGNVGACARALKNMGFDRFSMVSPKEVDLREASKMAVHAADLLQRVQEFSSIEEAVGQASWVVGVSGRPRSNPERQPPIGPGELIEKLRTLPEGAQTALLFGSESHGLTSEQLGMCQDILCLPTSADYTSLNLAQAVLLVAWELRRADLTGTQPESIRQTVSASQLEGFIQQAQRTLEVIKYLDPQNPRLILDELRRVFARADLDPRELAMLRGIFNRMDVWISEHGGPPTSNQLRDPRRGSS